MSLLERIYFFHDELNRDRYPNARTLMREFEISLPTARRDIAYLRDRLLAPLEFSQQKNGFYYTDENFNLPYENSPRIIFLLGMLNKLAEESGLGDLKEVKQLQKRLGSLVSEDHAHLGENIHCKWIEIEHPDPAIFDTIVEAIVKKRQLIITYQALSSPQTKRTIEPARLVNYQGRWYLAAWCTMRNDTRLFHVARINSSELGSSHSAQNATFSLDELDRSFGIFSGTPAYTAVISFTGSAADLVKNQYWHRDQLISQKKDHVVMSLPVSDDREIMMKILQFGAQAKVLEPAHLVEKIEREAAAMSTLYDQPSH